MPCPRYGGRDSSWAADNRRRGYPVAIQYQEHLPNAPYGLKGPSGEDLPLSVITRDLWHLFYQNQMQINGA